MSLPSSNNSFTFQQCSFPSSQVSDFFCSMCFSSYENNNNKRKLISAINSDSSHRAELYSELEKKNILSYILVTNTLTCFAILSQCSWVFCGRIWKILTWYLVCISRIPENQEGNSSKKLLRYSETKPAAKSKAACWVELLNLLGSCLHIQATVIAR